MNKMGKLKEGATYIYERDGGITYAREFQAEPNTRQIVGIDYNTKTLMDQLKEDQLWGDIRRAAQSGKNTALTNAVQQVIMLYHLSKENGS